jgi:RNA polymerase sigma-70 factor, ECF subfamily
MFTSSMSDSSAAEGSGNPSAAGVTNDRLPDDVELIRRVAEWKDEEAFRVLYGRHTAAVYGLLCRLIGRAADASDLMQETWLRAVRHLSLFRGQSAFRTWLTGIALNCYREWRRKHAREVAGADPDTRASPASWEDEVAAINQILAGLAPEHREVIVLHDIEGFTHEEIAAALEIEAGTSKSRLSRARRAFRERWRATA